MDDFEVKRSEKETQSCGPEESVMSGPNGFWAVLQEKPSFSGSVD